MKSIRLTHNHKHLLNDPELIIFDKDGTLIDVHYYWTSMIRIRSAFLADRFMQNGQRPEAESRLMDVMGIHEPTGRMKREGPVGIKPRPYIVRVVTDALCALGVKTTEQDIEACFKEVDKKTQARIGNFVRVLPGVEDFLKEAKDKGITLVVGTSDMTARATQGLKRAGVLHYFDEIIGGDRVSHAKPHPDIAQKAMLETGSHKDRTVMVGDHSVDIQMGQNAGVGLNIGVLTGLGDLSEFAGLSCEIVTSLTDLKLEKS